ncbi:MAG: ferritin-like domain-containing protein [Cyanobacteria bacterium P01_F01_bin.53]
MVGIGLSLTHQSRLKWRFLGKYRWAMCSECLGNFELRYFLMIATTPTQSQPISLANSQKNWTMLFAQNTKRWQQFAATIDFDTMHLEPEMIDSIKTFQLGEQAEGRTLTAVATQYAQSHDEPDYLTAMQQFIGEEQRHAHYMAIALRANGIEPLEKQWSDGLFRKLRKLCGWEMMISVLLTAEVIAIAYYSTLAKASQDPQAKRLFERILQDEVTHLQFHGERLSCARSGRFSTRWAFHRLFLWVVTGLVWVEHRHVLIHQFSSFPRFIQRCDALLTALV